MSYFFISLNEMKSASQCLYDKTGGKFNLSYYRGPLICFLTIGDTHVVLQKVFTPTSHGDMTII